VETLKTLATPLILTLTLNPSVVSQKLISGKVGHSKHDCSLGDVYFLSLQVATLFA
jgi:hypothetical protein